MLSWLWLVEIGKSRSFAERRRHKRLESFERCQLVVIVDRFIVFIVVPNHCRSSICSSTRVCWIDRSRSAQKFIRWLADHLGIETRRLRHKLVIARVVVVLGTYDWLGGIRIHRAGALRGVHRRDRPPAGNRSRQT